MESLRLEKIFKILKSNHQLSTATVVLVYFLVLVWMAVESTREQQLKCSPKEMKELPSVGSGHPGWGDLPEMSHWVTCKEMGRR